MRRMPSLSTPLEPPRYFPRVVCGLTRTQTVRTLWSGWFFFALVLALVLGVAWRWFEREPEEAGWTAAGIAALPHVARWEGPGADRNLVLAAILLAAGCFAVAARLV